MSALEDLDGLKKPTECELAEALDATFNFFSRYLYAGKQVLEVLAAFSAYSHVWERFGTAVYLMITSPTKECGKTRARELLELVVKKPLSAGSVTGPALVRAIEKWGPVLFLDEADGIHGLGEDGAALLRSVLNEGNRRGGSVIRCVGKDQTPTRLPAFCPKVLIGIGDFLSPTTASRTLKIILHRKPLDAPLEDFDFETAVSLALPIKEKLGLFSRVAEFPPVPKLEVPKDRLKDTCNPLLRVAAAAGESWHTRVRAALLNLAGTAQEPEELGEMTLKAVAELFVGSKATALPSAEICARLNADPEGPWQALRRGAGIDQRSLARILGRFDLRSQTVRTSDGTAKGYRAEAVVEMAGKYGLLHTGGVNVTPSQTNSYRHFPCYGSSADAARPSQEKSNENRACDGVTFAEGGTRETTATHSGNLFEEEEGELILWRPS